MTNGHCVDTMVIHTWGYIAIRASMIYTMMFKMMIWVIDVGRKLSSGS